jgi:hypothetical protein
MTDGYMDGYSRPIDRYLERIVLTRKANLTPVQRRQVVELAKELMDGNPKLPPRRAVDQAISQLKF